MFNNRRPRTNLRPKMILYAAVTTLLLSNMACGLPIGASPKPTLPPTIPSPTVSAAPTSVPVQLPPALVESRPPAGGELGINEPVTLYFNQPMDKTAVEAGLNESNEPGLTYRWVDEATVEVLPGEPLAPETVFPLVLDTRLRSSQGLVMAQPVNLSFRAAGYLRLVQQLPESGAQEVDPSAAIVAAFNRPVAALGDQPERLAPAFSIQPQPAGQGSWLNTSTYVFYPDPSLAGGESYKIQINPDLTGTDGAPMEEPVSWSFQTATPQLVQVQPETEIPWPLDPEIVLTFNQPVDKASIEEHFSLEFPDGQRVAGDFAWSEDDTKLTFTPGDLLARNTVYNLSLDDESLGGPVSDFASPFSAQVVTVPEFMVINSDPLPGALADPHSGLMIEFSSPLPEGKDLLPFMTLTPEVPDLQTSLSQNTVWLYGSFAANTDYLLTIRSDLSDIWGGKLEQDYQLAYKTKPFDPEIILMTGTDAVYLTSQDTSLAVQAINISEVPMTVGDVILQDLFQLLGPEGYDLRQNYQGLNQRSFTQPVVLPPDKKQVVDVFLSPEKQPLTPGVHFVRWDFPQPLDESLPRIYPGPYFIVVSDIQMTFKLSATDALIWAVDLRSDQPAADAPVVLFAEGGRQIATGRTDAQGLLSLTFEPRTDPYSPVYAVLGEPGSDMFGMAFSSWTSGIEPWDYGIQVDQRPPGLHLYMYTDRPIYRPGDEVHFRVVAKNKFNGRYSPAEIPSLPLSVFGAEGRELASLDLPLSAFGSAHGNIKLPEDAAPGFYSITSPLAVNAYLNFQVADYRKPEINLSVDFDQADIRAGEEASAAVDARYFTDAPAGNLKLSWSVYSLDQPFTMGGYQVGSEDLRWIEPISLNGYYGSLGKLITQGEGKTDRDGKLRLRIPTQVEKTRQLYTLEVTVQDESGLPVSSRGSLLVNPDSFYIGLLPDAWIGKAGEPIGFEVKTADWAADALDNLKLRAEFSKVTFQKKDPPPVDPFLEPSYTMVTDLIGSTDFVTGAEGLARLAFTPPEPGIYLLDVANPASVNGARSQILVWVGGEGQTLWPRLPNSRLRITADKEKYLAGETAHIFIPNPFGRASTALLSLERSVVMDSQLLEVPPEGITLSLPVTQETAPNLIVSVTLLGRSETGIPDFRQGFVNIFADPAAELLKVSLLSTPERAGPGDEVKFDLQITDANGQPVQGEFSLAVVDKAVLALADPNSEDIASAFFGEQPTGVRTSLSLVAYHRRQFEFPGGMGGGGGDAPPAVVRENFPDTAYWNAEVQTSEDGRATVSMLLPDSLTTWQVEARGLTKDARVGQASTEIVTSKELLVRPVTPRFFVAQDHAMLAAVVHNNSPVDMQVQVNLQAAGFRLDDPQEAARQVDIPAGGRSRLEWWGTVLDTGSVELIFSAEGTSADGSRYQDSLRPAQGAIPVLAYTAQQSFRTAGVLDTGGAVEELVSLPRSFQPSAGELEVELSPSLAAAMVAGLDSLDAGQHYSSEALLSSFLPNLEAYQTLQVFGIQDLALETRLDQSMSKNLLRLLARQNYDGGWSWWDGGQSDPYITAYVLFGLQRARLAGVPVNQLAMDQAAAFIQQSTSQASQPAGSELDAQTSGGIWPETTWQWDRQAFQQYVLAQSGLADAQTLESVYTERDRLSPWAQALLALALEKNSSGDQRSGDLLAAIQSSALRSAAGAYWEFSQDEEGRLAAGFNMQSSLANTAMVLYALAQQDPGSPLLADVVRFLMASRSRDGSWGGSYATSWTLLALSQVLKGTGELGGSFSFQASLNGTQIAEGSAGGAGQISNVITQLPIQGLHQDYPNSLKIEREAGPGRLYYSAGLNVAMPVDEVSLLSNGLSIERQVVPSGAECQKLACASIQSARAGENVTVRLTLTLPHDLFFVAITDFIPAGAEILDTQLKTSQLGGDGSAPESQVVYDPRQPFANGWGWWLFNAPQIYSDHISWTADMLPAGTYELTYTLVLMQPGTYRTIPARAWQLYFPDVQANSAGSVFEIRP